MGWLTKSGYPNSPSCDIRRVVMINSDNLVIIVDDNDNSNIIQYLIQCILYNNYILYTLIKFESIYSDSYSTFLRLFGR